MDYDKLLKSEGLAALTKARGDCRQFHEDIHSERAPVYAASHADVPEGFEFETPEDSDLYARALLGKPIYKQERPRLYTILKSLQQHRSTNDTDRD